MTAKHAMAPTAINSRLKQLLTVGALVLASPAAAQMTNCVTNGPFINCTAPDGTYTTCSRTGTVVSCNTMGNGRVAPTARSSGGAVAGMVGFFRSMKERRVQARVAKALRSGNCQVAIDEAFKGGNMAFAADVQAYCQRQPR